MLPKEPHIVTNRQMRTALYFIVMLLGTIATFLEHTFGDASKLENTILDWLVIGILVYVAVMLFLDYSKNKEKE